MKAYLITLEIEPLKMGHLYNMVPMHCTLVNWFLTDASTDAIRNIVKDAASGFASIPLVSGKEDEFTGFTKSGTIPVKVNKLLREEALILLHEKVCASLDTLQVQYTKPQFVKAGYQPHVTQHDGSIFDTGSKFDATVVDIIESNAPEYGNPRLIAAQIKL